jgi:molybdenum cofactor biosynthesis enzyme
MTTNNKTTSDKVATLASLVLSDVSSSATARSLAASALSQAKAGKQTGVEMESFASMVLQSSKYSKDTKTLAASILAQANKER